jgi:hypothetical protein
VHCGDHLQSYSAVSLEPAGTPADRGRIAACGESRLVSFILDYTGFEIGTAVEARIHLADISGFVCCIHPVQGGFFRILSLPLQQRESTGISACPVELYENNPGIFRCFPVVCRDRKKDGQESAENLTKSGKLSWEEIERFNKRKFELPVLVDTLLREGIYMRFEDFRNNRPFYDRFTVKKNKLTEEINIPDSAGGESIVSNLWGYCDGKNVFIRSLKIFYLPQRVNNSLYFYGAGVLVQIDRTFNFPYIPGGSPGANLVNAAALGVSIISSKKNAEPGNRAYLLDWDSGALF